MGTWAADPYDHNNGNDEPNNLGQALYLLSLFGEAVHPFVARVLAELHKYQDHRISGLTDDSPHPVYQTKWLKFGLQSLGLPDPWEANASQADYASMRNISTEYTHRRLAAPHTWHGAEMFFRLLKES